MPHFFTYHQINLAQHDGNKILLSMILKDSGILNLDFDFSENYTHINQICSMEHLSFAVNFFQDCSCKFTFSKCAGLRSSQLLS